MSDEQRSGTPDIFVSSQQCFNCGHVLESDALFCPHCRAPLPIQGPGFEIMGTGFAIMRAGFYIVFSGIRIIALGLMGIRCVFYVFTNSNLFDGLLFGFLGIMSLLLTSIYICKIRSEKIRYE